MARRASAICFSTCTTGIFRRVLHGHFAAFQFQRSRRFERGKQLRIIDFHLLRGLPLRRIAAWAFSAAARVAASPELAGLQQVRFELAELLQDQLLLRDGGMTFPSL